MLLLCGLVAWLSKICYAVKLDRSQFKLINCVVFCIGFINFTSIIWDLYEKEGLSEMKQIISWILLSMWLQLKLVFQYFANNAFNLFCSILISITNVELEFVERPVNSNHIMSSLAIYYDVIVIWTIVFYDTVVKCVLLGGYDLHGEKANVYGTSTHLFNMLSVVSFIILLVIFYIATNRGSGYEPINWAGGFQTSIHLCNV